MCFGGRERVRERYTNWSVSPKVNEVHLFKFTSEGGGGGKGHLWKFYLKSKDRGELSCVYNALLWVFCK